MYQVIMQRIESNLERLVVDRNYSDTNKRNDEEEESSHEPDSDTNTSSNKA